MAETPSAGSWIPVQRPLLPTAHEALPYLESIDRTRRYSNHGPLVGDLERRLAEHFDVPSTHLTSFSSGTTALEAAIACAPAPEGSIWTVPSWTFTATVSGVLRAGGRARFVDVDEEWRTPPSQLTGTGVDVLPFGVSPNLERIPRVSHPLVVDAAASFDAMAGVGRTLPKDRPVAAMVSLHATKAPGCGEGGVLLSNDGEWVARARRWGNFGLTAARQSVLVGTNAKMSEIQAAMSLAALDRWPVRRGQWLRQSTRAIELARSTGTRIRGGLPEGSVSSYFVIQCADEGARDLLERSAGLEGVDTRRWWEAGCHRMPAFRHLAADPLPNTEAAARTSLGLPFFIDMHDSDWERIGRLLATVARSGT